MSIETKSKPFAGKTLAWADLPPKSVLLMLQTKSGRMPSTAPERVAGTMRAIIIDGVLMELAEEIIIGQVRAGTFIVVYPGTNIPWTRNGPHVPDYPPDWFPPM